MKIDTERVLNKKYECAINSTLFKDSQEYFALATLRYLFPEKYADVIRKDKPDLQGSKVFAEVTIFDSDHDMQANREFSKFLNDNKNQRKNTITKRGYETRILKDDKWILAKSGTFNESIIKKRLVERIQDKIKKLMDIRYLKRYWN